MSSDAKDTNDNKEDAVFNELENTEATANRPVRVGKRTWYRTTYFNISVISACAFIGPGLWAAMNGLGAGGAQSPYYVNAANSVLFAPMFTACIFGCWLIARVNMRWALVCGMLGFPIYSASLYCHVKYSNNWYLMLACVIDGGFSGIFWLTEGAVVLSYPEKNRRGKYLAYWLASRIIGQMVGGSISLSINAKSRFRGHISVNTYLIFIGIQCVGPFLAMLLSTPEKVQRSDGTRIKINLPRSLKEELKAMWSLLCRWEILLLSPMIFQSVFSEAFFSTYNATYFTVRSRALASLVASACVIVGNFILGFWLDWGRISINTRARAAFISIYAFELSLYIYAYLTCKEYERMPTVPTIDWMDSGYGHGVCVYILMLVGFNLMYDYLYWLMGTINKNGAEIIRLSAVIRGIESIGQAISYSINSVDGFKLSGAVIINMSFFLFCIIPSYVVIHRVGIVNGEKVHAIIQDEQPEEDL